MSVFRYSKGPEAVPILKEGGKVLVDLGPGVPGCFIGTIDLVAADFNGDGRDDLAIAQVIDDMAIVQGMLVRATFIAGGPKLALQPAGYYEQVFPCARNGRIQAAAGLFRYDPENGFDFGQRQLALSFPSQNGCLTVLKVTPSDDLSTATDPQLLDICGPSGPSAAYIARNRFALAVGNFRGYVQQQDPLWSLVVGTWNDDGYYRLTAVRVSSKDGTLSIAARQAVDGPTTPVDDGARPALVAYDHDGDSVYLGAPVHITLSNMARTDFIVQEPPKHLAYLNGRIVNVSRRSEFYVELLDSSSNTFKSTSTDQTDFGFGASLQVSSKKTVSAQRDIGIAKVGGQLSLEATAEAGYDYDEHRESYNSSYATRTLTFTGQTNADDYLVSQVQLFDIWRYRAYGVKTKNQGDKPTYAFYELVLPGSRMTARGGGLTFDWYQPLHENGNILSYPRLTDSSSTPSDLGSFELPNGQTVKEPLIPPQLLNYDGTSGTVQLEFTENSGAGRAREYSHTLSASLDVGVSGKVSARAFGVGASSEWSVNASLTGDKSWGNLATCDSNSSKSTGITLKKPFNGDSTRNYPFAPLVYITKDGTFKVTHTVGNLNGTDSWWQEKFGAEPDPALNLPRRFIFDQDAGENGKWKPNLRDSRKQMRGFFVCQPAALASAPCEELSRQPTEGQVVRLLARVYNYSTAKTARDLTVRFEAVVYDTATNKDIGPRHALGKIKIANLAPRQMKEASFN